MLIADDSLPTACAEGLAHPDRVVAAPGPVWTKVGGPQVSVTRTEAIKQEMLGHSHLKAFAEINRCTPRVFYANSVKGPGVEILRDILAEQEARFAKQHEAPELATAERAHLEQAGEHVSGEGVTG